MVKTDHSRQAALCLDVGSFAVVVWRPHGAVGAAVRAAGHVAAPWHQLGAQRLFVTILVCNVKVLATRERQRMFCTTPTSWFLRK